MIRFFERHERITWTVVGVIALSIFLISSRSFYGHSSFGVLSLIYHVSAFFLLSLFLLFAVVRGRYVSMMFPALIAVIIYGITDEVHQLFVPGRYFSVGDIILDMVGASLASLLYALLLIIRQK